MGQIPGLIRTYPLVIAQVLLSLLAGLLYFLSRGHPVSLAPLGLVPVYIVYREILRRENPDQIILLGFIILAFVIDDISQVAWGRSVDTLTEALGALLFQSFGISGMEAFIFLFTAWILFRELPRSYRKLYRLGFFTTIAVGFSVFLSSLISGFIGVTSGGIVHTMFIQIRFLHALPLWVAIGFVVWRDEAFTAKALKWITILVTLKSVQALFVYAMNRGIFLEEEYLVDHYFSGFAVIGLIGLAYYFLMMRDWKVRLACVLGALAIALAFYLNDRRTSYVGIAFGLAALPTLIPFTWIKRYAVYGVSLGLVVGLFTAATWNLPPPLGFIGSLYRSFGSETGVEEPSYRDLENANLFNAVTQSPNIGIGYGKEFDEIFPLPDISTVYDRYRMIPHNSFLASWAYGGPQTIAALSLIFATMIISAGALMRRATASPPLILLSFMALFYTFQYLTYTFGDLGFQIMRNQMMAGLFLGACCRLHAELKAKGV